MNMSEHFLGSNKAFEILANLGLEPLAEWSAAMAAAHVAVAAAERSDGCGSVAAAAVVQWRVVSAAAASAAAQAVVAAAA